MLETWPERTRLYRFMADPPTTTIQRVKTLVTGSLPTFIDASSNFATMELQEDNIIDQVILGKNHNVLLGDDTWARLLPGRWLRSYALYSFHTWDLDTVDNEVDSKIYDEIQKKDWDLLIAHYLGVDHAGHRYGPNHSEMTRKLNELNDRLKRIIDILPPDVLLYVIGDHGMTDTGDHGGESKAERTAAFFAYRKTGFSGTADIGAEIEQTDFAPTLSTALGRPPPAPSIGSIFPPVLPQMKLCYMLLHFSNNLKQIAYYLVRYGEESQQVALDRLANLINATREKVKFASTVHSEDDLLSYVAKVRSLVDNIRGVFREVWVEFDSLSMLRALLLLFGGLISGAMLCVLVIMHWDGISQRWYEGRSPAYERFARAALMASAAVLVSNSYIIEEGAGLSFLFVTVTGLFALRDGSSRAFILWASCSAVMTISRYYRGCREEQGDCWTSGGNAAFGGGQASRGALVLALTSMGAVVSISRRHIGWRGYGVVLAGLLACAHWAVGWGPLGSAGRSRLLARGAWLTLVTMFSLLWQKDRQGPILPVSVLVLLLYIANSRVLGASLAPTAGIALLSGFLTIMLITSMKNERSSKLVLSLRSNSSVACAWALLASYHFYGTGHHATLGHIRWAPAFHAGDPVYLPLGTYISGSLVMLELFGMPLMFGAAVPLLILWGKNDGSVSPRTQLAAVFTLSLKFNLCFAIRVFVCTLSATMHCRHLMIWGVFTPKLLFEAGACTAAFLGTLIGTALAAWHMPSQQKPS
ncbi:GPI ethanolamine phosphate transferase 3 [Eumeta japonica]|uniref:GPI ethanolamine phosphate transferase 3 n=1 Tax=Eumeta variegata TaxID=151549 RepID=A0A4C1T1W2_EUMVA|nr:GPI ethanolamine phosphate transferase 3 [Eumeta japonica]